MSVKKRKTSGGETSEYHYRFMHKGKDYSGVCEKCKDKQSALAFEKEIKDQIKKSSEAETSKKLFETMRKKLIGEKNVKLSGAFDLSAQKPRSRYPSENVLKDKKAKWQDFISFMEDNYPEIKNLSDVKRNHAEEYINYIQNNGKWNKKVTYIKNGKEFTYEMEQDSQSAYTANHRLIVIKEVFTRLFTDAGLYENPFAHIQKMTSDEFARDIFTEDELLLIRNNPDDFCTPLFTIGAMTAMRLGDVCTLRWDEIDFEFAVIKKILRKTSKKNKVTEIPILGTVSNYLQQLKQDVKGDYVLPEQAEMYLNNRHGVSWRIKKYLNELGIKTSKKVEGRSREVHCKDFHSLRHTFCYLAGIQGIPLSIVQSIVGHMTPAMTEHYSKHATRKDRIKAMEKMPDFLMISNNQLLPSTNITKREKLKNKIDELSDQEIDKATRLIENVLKKR